MRAVPKKPVDEDVHVLQPVHERALIDRAADVQTDAIAGAGVVLLPRKGPHALAGGRDVRRDIRAPRPQVAERAERVAAVIATSGHRGDTATRDAAEHGARRGSDLSRRALHERVERDVELLRRDAIDLGHLRGRSDRHVAGRDGRQ